MFLVWSSEPWRLHCWLSPLLFVFAVGTINLAAESVHFGEIISLNRRTSEGQTLNFKGVNIVECATVANRRLDKWQADPADSRLILKKNKEQ